MQAGEERKAGGSPTIEQLLEEAARGRSKYDRLAGDIDRLRAGGVTLRAIVAWVETQGVKSEVGELGQWLKRRKARQAKLMEHQALLSQGETQAGKKVGASAPTAVPARPAAAPKSALETGPAQTVRIDPSDRPGNSEVMTKLGEVVEAAKQEARAKRSPFGLKGANKR